MCERAREREREREREQGKEAVAEASGGAGEEYQFPGVQPQCNGKPDGRARAVRPAVRRGVVCPSLKAE